MVLSAYRWLHRRTPASAKRTARLLLEALPGAGRRSFYGQFGEDAFLQGYFEAKAWKASPSAGARLPLSRPGLPRGFYVDVGAFSPKHFSNTYHFYRRGWSGINIDAAPGSMRAFRVLRPRDVNLEVAISDSDGEKTMLVWSTHAGVNTLSSEHAREVSAAIGREPERVKVRTRPLTSVLDEHVPPGRPIDFLSVDVEGHDLHVLRSLDWNRYRPELVLVEDHRQSVEALAASDISRFLGDAGYVIHAWIPPTVVYRAIGAEATGPEPADE